MKKTKKQSRLISLLFLAALSTSLMTALINANPSSVSAATSYSGMSIRDKAQVWVMGRAVSECVNDRGFETNNKSEGDINNNGEWMYSKAGFDGSTDIGEWAADITEGNSDDSRANCATAAKKTLSLMGINGVDALCTMNELAGKEIWVRENNGGDCRNGATDLDFNESNNDKKDTSIWNRFFADWMGIPDVKDALINSGLRYVIYTENFYQECSQDNGKGWGSPREWNSSDKETDKIYKIKWNLNRSANGTGGADKEWYVVSSGNKSSQEVHIDGYGLLKSGDTLSCSDLAKRINDNAAEYLSAIQDNPDGTTVSGDSTAPEKSCESEGGALSYVGCPIINALDGAINVLSDSIEALLNVDDATYKADSVETAWRSFRNVAFLILIPMMLLMVIGTALQFGPFDAYTVKKALPRMLIAIMFIALSLPITQFFVELSNVVGKGISGLILGVSDSPLSLSALYSAGEGSVFTVLTVGAAGAVGFAALSGAGGAILALVGSFALVTMVALLIGFIILVLRELLITLLIILAPIAILVWIFPGNDKLWGVWKGTFIALLMMFPFVMILIASGSVFAGIIDQTQSGFVGFFAKIIAYIAPFFFIPATFKFGMGVFGTVAGVMNDRGRGIFDRQRKFRQNQRAGLNKNIAEGRIPLGEGKSGRGYRRVTSGNFGLTARQRRNFDQNETAVTARVRDEALKNDNGRAFANDDATAAALHATSSNDFLQRYSSRALDRENDSRSRKGLSALSGDELASFNKTTGADAKAALGALEVGSGARVGTRTMRATAYAARAASTKGYDPGEAGIKELYDDGARLVQEGIIDDGDAAQAIKSNKNRADQSGAGFGDVFAGLAAAKQAGGLRLNGAADGTMDAKKLLKAANKGARPGEIIGGHTDAIKALAPEMRSRVVEVLSTGSGEEIDRHLASLAGKYDAMSQVSEASAEVMAQEVMSQTVSGPNGQNITIRDLIESRRNAPGFLDMRREYGRGETAAHQANQLGIEQPPRP